jgi:prolyl oligopeptidase PreP (S9A serine peptidase family)
MAKLTAGKHQVWYWTWDAKFSGKLHGSITQKKLKKADPASSFSLPGQGMVFNKTIANWLTHFGYAFIKDLLSLAILKEHGGYLFDTKTIVGPAHKVPIASLLTTEQTEQPSDFHIARLRTANDRDRSFNSLAGQQWQAPRGRIISLDIRKPAQKSWKEIVPQSEATLRSANLVGGKLVTNYLRDAKSEIIIRDLAGKEIQKVALPGIGSAGGFGVRSDQKETFYSFSGFTSPKTIYRYDFTSGESTVFKQPKVDFDATQFETKQVFYSSKDGTKVPMFLVHKKGLELDGKNPTMLYGYGGFSVSLTPGFSIQRIAWLEMGGVLAIPNLRGGGEYGEEWHVAGTKLHKQTARGETG